MLSEQYKAVFGMFKSSGMKEVFLSEGEELKKGILANYRQGEVKPLKEVSEHYEITEFDVEGVNCYKYVNNNAVKTIIYLHGGGFFMDIMDAHWPYCAQLHDAVNAEVYLPQYPVSPESNCEPTYKMLVTLYKNILKEVKPENIVIMGDSAGGGITLSFAMLLREKGLPQPKELILITPCLKLAKVEQEDREFADQLEAKDPIISYQCMESVRQMWGGERSQEDYIVNPFYDNIRDLAPITLFTGTADILYLYNKQFYEKMEKEGFHFDMIVREDLMHDYVLLPVPEAVEDQKAVIELILR